MAWTHVGALGVNLFFTLSGFLIAQSVLRPAQWDGRRYLTQRSLRILPNYFIALFFAITVVGSVEFLHASPGAMAGNLVTHLALIHGWFTQFTFSILGPFWTLSHEWSFYMLMFLTASLLRSRRWWLLPAGMAALAFLLRLAQFNRWVSLPCAYVFPPCLWDQFAFGMVAAWLSCNRSAQRVLARPVVWWSIVLAASAVITWAFWKYGGVAVALGAKESSRLPFEVRFDAMFQRSRWNMLGLSPALAAGFAMLILAVWLKHQAAARILRFTPLPWMGRVSYSTYLWHMAVVGCFFRVLKRKQLPENSIWQADWPRFLLVLISVYLFSAFAYRFFEMPWLRRKDRLVESKTAGSQPEPDVLPAP